MGFDRRIVTVSVDGTECGLCVWVAETTPQRRRGLAGVTSIGDADGMVFVYSSPTDAEFWMRDTLIPLDIVFIAADDHVVGSATMTPCTSSRCPTYGADRPFVLALETESMGPAVSVMRSADRVVLSEMPCDGARFPNPQS